ncbi:uncharacterized protein LOC134708651 [Mytilus trossulus]|uniref:uncharacterized protein LOC134708651 n=1 Tax=Mytilus trossulus TaxID=6551 RepID=UPI0030042723
MGWRIGKVLILAMTISGIYLVLEKFPKERYNRTLLLWSQGQSIMRTTKELFNRNFLSQTRHLSDIRSKNQTLQDEITLSDNTCIEIKTNRHIARQFKQNGKYAIVVPKYQLIFFWSEKSACTYWKRILQFIQGINRTILHDPRSGLKTLDMFSNCKIMEIMSNEQWVKAAFVREPRERILSSYLDKGQHRHVMNEVCQINRTLSFNEFLEIIKQCNDGHWSKQLRAPEYFYKQMMVGKFSHISSFTEKLLKRIGAWNEKVANWITSSKHIYQPHATNSKNKLLAYYNNTKSQDLIFNLFSDDYRVFGYDRTYLK